MTTLLMTLQFDNLATDTISSNSSFSDLMEWDADLPILDGSFLPEQPEKVGN